jgi:hypothetical protein
LASYEESSLLTKNGHIRIQAFSSGFNSGIFSCQRAGGSGFQPRNGFSAAADRDWTPPLQSLIFLWIF